LVEQTEGTALVFAVPNLLSGLASRAARVDAETEREPGASAKMCVVCGTTLSDVLETGLLGCAACYEVFAANLESGLGANQAGLDHLGKVPGRTMAGDPGQREVFRLRRMLKELIDSERYEEAASVRDRLAELARLPGGES
jgi:protein arginine kinase activator